MLSVTLSLILGSSPPSRDCLHLCPDLPFNWDIWFSNFSNNRHRSLPLCPRGSLLAIKYEENKETKPAPLAKVTSVWAYLVPAETWNIWELLASLGFQGGILCFLLVALISVGRGEGGCSTIFRLCEYWLTDISIKSIFWWSLKAGSWSNSALLAWGASVWTCLVVAEPSYLARGLFFPCRFRMQSS